jgi:hypothetical protein
VASNAFCRLNCSHDSDQIECCVGAGFQFNSKAL